MRLFLSFCTVTIFLGFSSLVHSFTLPFLPETINKIAVEPVPVPSTPTSTLSENLEKNADKIFQKQNLLTSENAGQLLQNLEEESIREIIFSQDLTVVLSLGNDDTLTKTTINPVLVPELIKDAKKHNTEIVFMPPIVKNNFLEALFYIPLVYFGFGFLRSLFMGRSFPVGDNNPMFTIGTGGGGLNSLDAKKQNITLNDWAGSPEIFEECTEIVSYLKNNTNYLRIGAKIPRGILLEGSPGTGKTLLAKAIANEAEANFISVSGSEFVELFVGMGAARVRKLFQEARRKRPAIIFIDEIDAVGKKRSVGINFGNDEREQTLNQLLSEMDGFNNNDNILIIAATNRKDVLDPALLRPGRFDRILTVPLPDASSRKQIFNVHRKSFQVEEHIDLDRIAGITNGLSGAEIKNLLNEAAILVARRGGPLILEADILQALEKLKVGIQKKVDSRSDEGIKRVAVHEMGHTLAILEFPETFIFDKVTLQSTYNGAGGYTLFREKEELMEDGMYTREQFMQRLMGLLGGKAAEFIYYGRDQVSMGAYSDLKQANSLAKKMILDYGMGDELEVFSHIPRDSESLPLSESTTALIDKEAQEIVNEAYEAVIQLLRSKKCVMDRMINYLLRNPKRYLDREDVKMFL